MKKVFILAVLTLVGQNSWAQIREFKTTRLLSTAGAGVASILSTEAALLNPAASAFFDAESVAYHGYRTTLQKKSLSRNTDPFPQSNRSQGIFLSDNSNPVKGGVAYISQDENNFERNRMVLHGAAPMGSSTSMGVSYSYLKDSRPRTYKHRHLTHHQASLGITHLLDEKTVLGVVVQDPTRTTPGEEKAIVGFQYTLTDRFIVMGDFGAQYTKNISDKYLWRGSIQMNVFSDFFIRFGRFFDNTQKLKGTGWGISWMGPKLGVEFSQLYSQQFDSGFYVYKDERLVDTALSAVIKF
jgi:hypothetical protein